MRGPSLKGIDVRLPSSCEGFRKFSKLQRVTLEGHCPYFEKSIGMEQTAPPSLISLTAKGDMFRLSRGTGLELADDYQAHVDWITKAAALIESVRSVCIVTSRTYTSFSSAHRHAIIQLGKTFKQSNVAMQLYKSKRNGWVPPFLYGENEDTCEMVYDTESASLCQEFRMRMEPPSPDYGSSVPEFDL